MLNARGQITDDALNRGLVSWWMNLPGNAGRGSFTWYDLCRRNDGKLKNIAATPTTTSGWNTSRGRQGGFGSLAFDGTNDYVAIANSSSTQISGDMSCCAWVWFTNWADNGHETILVKGPHASGLNYLFGKYNNPNRLKFTYNDGSFRDNYDNSGWTATSQRWYQLGWVLNKTAKTIGFYANGVLLSTVTDPANLNYSASSSTGARIGANGSAGEVFGGLIDDVRLFNCAKSPAEMRAIYLDSIFGYSRTLQVIGVESPFDTIYESATVTPTGKPTHFRHLAGMCNQ